MKRMFPIICVGLLIAGCNLTSAPINSTQLDQPIPTRTLTTEDQGLGDIPTTMPDSTIEASTNSSDDSPTGTICQVQENWFEYTVQRGDNLSRIATITNSTVDELITANCLDNPNRIRVGDRIFVPNEPR